MNAVVIFVVVVGFGRTVRRFIRFFRINWKIPGVNPRPALRGSIPGQPANQSIQRTGQSAKKASAQASDIRGRVCDLPSDFTDFFGSRTVRFSLFLLAVFVLIWHWWPPRVRPQVSIRCHA